MEYSGLQRLTEELQRVVEDQTRLQGVLEQRGLAAQVWLDRIQQVVDYPNTSPKLRSSLFTIMLRLSKKSGLHPKCLSIQNVRKLGDFPIAAGGFGDVWKGAIGESSQPVCLKIVKLYLGSDVEKLSKDYLREAIVWRQTRHANLLPFLGIYRLEQTQQLCLISPWMEKGNLIQYLKATRRENVKHYTLVRDVASGLCHLHHMKIVHGDLKGVNILVTPDERACIGDFGLSRVADSHRLSLPTSTSRGPAGTARWLAPELLTGSNGYGTTKESDVYAFGCVCYEIFTGLHPFPEISPDAAVVLQVIMGTRPTRPTDTVELNDSMWAIMESCWTADPHARPNVDDLLAQVEQDNWVPSATSPDWVEPLHRQIWSNVEHRPPSAEFGQQSESRSSTSITPPTYEDIFPTLDEPSMTGIYSGNQSPPQLAPSLRNLAYILPAITFDNHPSLATAFDDHPPPAAPVLHNPNGIAARIAAAEPLPRVRQYPGWLSDAVKPLQEFIDKSIDPREYYLDLQEIVKQKSGSIYAARVTDTGQIRKLNLPPLIKARDADDRVRGVTTLVALKCVRITSSGLANVNDLRRELDLLRGLSHPNVLSMDALYIDLVENSLWIRMELTERSLADVLALNQSGLELEEQVIAGFASDVVEALEFLESHNIAHRNIRSVNLLLDIEGVVKLTDFSNALKLHKGMPIAYAPPRVLYHDCQAPEIQNGAYNALKADIWSLGVIVWEMARARLPFPDSEYPPINSNYRLLLDRPQSESFSPAFYDFWHLCHGPAATRPSPCDLRKSQFIRNSCSRLVMVETLQQCELLLRQMGNGAERQSSPDGLERGSGRASADTHSNLTRSETSSSSFDLGRTITTTIAPVRRYPGWLSEVVRPLDEFIDEPIDPRDYYLDLQEIAEGKNGWFFVARVTETGDIHRLKLPPLVKARNADDQIRGTTTFVAIKCVQIVPSVTSTNPLVDDLRRELVLLRGLSHPNVLSMDALYVDLVEDSLWIRMDLVERSLTDVLDLVTSGLVLEERMIARFTSDIVEALQCLRSYNIAHRDVRSGNLLLDSEGVLKLADFSKAIKLPEESPMAYEPVGTLYWQAPEVRAGPYNAFKADVWSLGATVWEMAQARPPFADSEQPPGDRWPPLDRPQLFSRGFREFLHLCSEPAASRPDPSELKHFVQNSCGRPIIVQLLQQCMTIEEIHDL